MADALFPKDMYPAPIRVAQVVGLTGAAFISGKTLSQSLTTPALLEAPAPLLAKQWKKMFDADKLLAPAVVVLSSGILGYLAYKEGSITHSHSSQLYAASSTLLLTTIPYSLLTLEPVNQKLEEKATSLAKASITDASAEAGIAQEETTHFLVDRWATMNLGRTLLTGVASIVGVWAAVERMNVASFKLGTGANRMGN